MLVFLFVFQLEEEITQFEDQLETEEDRAIEAEEWVLILRAIKKPCIWFSVHIVGLVSAF